MKRRYSTLPVWALSTALFLTLVVIACQPSGPVDNTLLPPSATPMPVDDSPLSLTVAPVATVEGQVPAPIITAPEPPASTDQKVILLTQQDLAGRLKIDPEAIAVRFIEPVMWPDASLGCPRPGLMYAQVITPGYLVLLEVEGTVYEYHTDQQAAVVLCQGGENTGGRPSKGSEGAVQDGWPNQPRDPDVIIVPPPERKW
jgi:hypothetical protein